MLEDLLKVPTKTQSEQQVCTKRVAPATTLRPVMSHMQAREKTEMERSRRASLVGEESARDGCWRI